MQDFTPILNDNTYNQILTAIGYPVVRQEDLDDNLLTKADITELVIKPSLVEFCKFFPDRQNIVITTSGAGGVQQYSNDISELAFAMYYYKFSPASTTISNGSLMNQGNFYANPFYSASQVISVGGGSSISRYGTPFPYGAEQILYQQRFYQKSVESANKVYYAQFDDRERLINFKSSIAGNFEITLALIRTDIEQIEYQYRQSFIRYCKGALKLQLADILGLSQTDLPVQLEVADLKDDGKELMEKELTYWREASLHVLMR